MALPEVRGVLAGAADVDPDAELGREHLGDAVDAEGPAGLHRARLGAGHVRDVEAARIRRRADGAGHGVGQDEVGRHRTMCRLDERADVPVKVDERSGGQAAPLGAAGQSVARARRGPVAARLIERRIPDFFGDEQGVAQHAQFALDEVLGKLRPSRGPLRDALRGEAVGHALVGHRRRVFARHRRHGDARLKLQRLRGSHERFVRVEPDLPDEVGIVDGDARGERPADEDRVGREAGHEPGQDRVDGPKVGIVDRHGSGSYQTMVSMGP